MKRITKTYREGVPYTLDVSPTVPEGIVKMLCDGSATSNFIQSYYTSTVKGMFNSIYGCMAQDIYKTDYMVSDGEICVDHDTTLTQDNFADRQPKTCKVLYTYGLRIVGGSRMHLVIALELLYKALGDKVRCCGGDTDSLKISCDDDVTDDDLVAALAPIADASKLLIERGTDRIRRNYPKLASTLDKVGSFDVETCGDDTTRWAWHMDAWNKARVSADSHGHTHLTCAGISRPRDSYNIQDFMDELLEHETSYVVFPEVLGYNVWVSAELSHSLQRTKPGVRDRFVGNVTDYLGHTSHVDAPEAVALYPMGRALGESDISGNAQTLSYLERHYGRKPPQDMRALEVHDGHATMVRDADL